MLSSYTALIDGRAQRAEFERFYSGNRKAGLIRAYAILQDKADAEDALSEAFLRLARCFGRVRSLPENKLRAYFAIIVKNAALDILRKTSKEQLLPYDDEAQYDIAELPDASEERLSECIQRLSESNREILYMRYDLELSHGEIAAALGISEEASRQRVRYAKSKLRAELLKEE
ncbi:MAG: sigma-70 family RNA polymerase sigma factor [Ruminococcus sp.]|nr:sigma-70 family RNA polymerase sigma factor [Ruminococcus sp.]